VKLLGELWYWFLRFIHWYPPLTIVARKCQHKIKPTVGRVDWCEGCLEQARVYCIACGCGIHIKDSVTLRPAHLFTSGVKAGFVHKYGDHYVGCTGDDCCKRIPPVIARVETQYAWIMSSRGYGCVAEFPLTPPRDEASRLCAQKRRATRLKRFQLRRKPVLASTS